MLQNFDKCLTKMEQKWDQKNPHFGLVGGTVDKTWMGEMVVLSRLCMNCCLKTGCLRIFIPLSNILTNWSKVNFGLKRRWQQTPPKCDLWSLVLFKRRLYTLKIPCLTWVFRCFWDMFESRKSNLKLRRINLLNGCLDVWNFGPNNWSIEWHWPPLLNDIF